MKKLVQQQLDNVDREQTMRQVHNPFMCFFNSTICIGKMNQGGDGYIQSEIIYITADQGKRSVSGQDYNHVSCHGQDQRRKQTGGSESHPLTGMSGNPRTYRHSDYDCHKHDSECQSQVRAPIL